MFIILALIVLVACFNIASTLIMMVIEKTKDIGILKSIGATNKMINSIFTLEGLLIGLFGTVSGLVIGIGLCGLLKKYQFIQLPKEIYYIDHLPVLMQWSDAIIISASAILISLLATVYPAWQAARLNAVDALRYE
jgi:lipoprotein-releasing system permease protein